MKILDLIHQALSECESRSLDNVEDRQAVLAHIEKTLGLDEPGAGQHQIDEGLEVLEALGFNSDSHPLTDI